MAESALIAAAPVRLAVCFVRAFGLQCFAPPLAADPILIELVRAEASREDPAINGLADRIAHAFSIAAG